MIECQSPSEIDIPKLNRIQSNDQKYRQDSIISSESPVLKYGEPKERHCGNNKYIPYEYNEIHVDKVKRYRNKTQTIGLNAEIHPEVDSYSFRDLMVESSRSDESSCNERTYKSTEHLRLHCQKLENKLKYQSQKTQKLREKIHFFCKRNEQAELEQFTVESVLRKTIAEGEKKFHDLQVDYKKTFTSLEDQKAENEKLVISFNREKHINFELRHALLKCSHEIRLAFSLLPENQEKQMTTTTCSVNDNEQSSNDFMRSETSARSSKIKRYPLNASDSKDCFNAASYSSGILSKEFLKNLACLPPQIAFSILQEITSLIQKLIHDYNDHIPNLPFMKVNNFEDISENQYNNMTEDTLSGMNSKLLNKSNSSRKIRKTNSLSNHNKVSYRSSMNEENTDYAKKDESTYRSYTPIGNNLTNYQSHNVSPHSSHDELNVVSNYSKDSTNLLQSKHMQPSLDVLNKFYQHSRNDGVNKQERISSKNLSTSNLPSRTLMASNNLSPRSFSLKKNNLDIAMQLTETKRNSSIRGKTMHQTTSFDRPYSREPTIPSNSTRNRVKSFDLTHNQSTGHHFSTHSTLTNIHKTNDKGLKHEYSSFPKRIDTFSVSNNFRKVPNT